MARIRGDFNESARGKAGVRQGANGAAAALRDTPLPHARVSGFSVERDEVAEDIERGVHRLGTALREVKKLKR